MLWRSVREVAGEKTRGPEVTCQSTGIDVVGAELSARVTRGVQTTMTPAAMYWTDLLAARLRLRLAEGKEAVWVPAVSVAVRVMAPEDCGTTVVEAMPEASARRVQVERPQALNWTAPPVAVKVMLWLPSGVTPSGAIACTLKGTDEVSPTKMVP